MGHSFYGNHTPLLREICPIGSFFNHSIALKKFVFR